MSTKIIKKGIWASLAVAVVFAAAFQKEGRQLYHTIRLFHPDVIVENFSRLPSLADHKIIPRHGAVNPFTKAITDLPTEFVHRGKQLSVSKWLEQTSTTALLVVQGDEIKFENYYQGTGEFDQRISWSMAKSFLSALFGIAVEEGHIPDLNAPVTEYVPELKGSGYEGVTIKNVLQMSSGIYFNEDYSDFFSDINRLGRILALGGSFDDFAASLTRGEEQGQRMHYVSIDTHVVGMVLRAATGTPITEYFYDKLWSKLGTEKDAIYITDSLGEPMVLGGVNIITRDYARFAQVYRDFGRLDGQQIIPEQWVKDSLTADAPHLLAKRRENGSVKFGYGYQWWLPLDADEEFLAIGIYGQYIYVNRHTNVVIVKNSADIDFMANNYESKEMAVSAFRAISDSLK